MFRWLLRRKPETDPSLAIPSQRRDLNPQPSHYECDALPIEATLAIAVSKMTKRNTQPARRNAEIERSLWWRSLEKILSGADFRQEARNLLCRHAVPDSSGQAGFCRRCRFPSLISVRPCAGRRFVLLFDLPVDLHQRRVLGAALENQISAHAGRFLYISLLPDSLMRILFLGDIVGKPGCSAVLNHAKDLRNRLQLDALIVNAENAMDGSGLTPSQYKRLISAGVDGITLGDHIYKCKDVIDVLNSSSRIVKPANYPADASGRTWTIVDTPAGPLGIISLMGRVFMRPVDCPMAAAEQALEEIALEMQSRGQEADRYHVLVDVHAEATSDKQMLGRFLDGRVTAVLGTHTHVATADAEVFPGGTAFQCDVGMCGPYESIIGRDVGRVTQTARSFEPIHFYVATKDVRLSGALVEANPDGTAASIERFEQRIS